MVNSTMIFWILEILEEFDPKSSLTELREKQLDYVLFPRINPMPILSENRVDFIFISATISFHIRHHLILVYMLMDYFVIFIATFLRITFILSYKTQDKPTTWYVTCLTFPFQQEHCGGIGEYLIEIKSFLFFGPLTFHSSKKNMIILPSSKMYNYISTKQKSGKHLSR